METYWVTQKARQEKVIMENDLDTDTAGEDCKGNCGAELNQILAGGPKLIYC